jgi:hypothetical protein
MTVSFFSISKMELNETIKTKMGLKKDMLQETDEQEIKMVWPHHTNRGLQNCWAGSRMEPTGRPVNIWQDGIGYSMQSRNLKDEECFN